jgi:hypothetical protein
VPDPDGGVPEGALEPLPMLGQFLVELDPELEPEPVDEFEEPEPDDGVVGEELEVEEFDVELVPVLPELPVVVDVVAALATIAPPATRPDVSAPMASTLRRRICMGVCPFLSLGAGSFEPVLKGCAPDLSAAAEGRGRVGGVTYFPLKKSM